MHSDTQINSFEIRKQDKKNPGRKRPGFFWKRYEFKSMPAETRRAVLHSISRQKNRGEENERRFFTPVGVYGESVLLYVSVKNNGCDAGCRKGNGEIRIQGTEGLIQILGSVIILEN